MNEVPAVDLYPQAGLDECRFRLQKVGTADWRMLGISGQVDMKKTPGVEPFYTQVYGFTKNKDTSNRQAATQSAR